MRGGTEHLRHTLCLGGRALERPERQRSLRVSENKRAAPVRRLLGVEEAKGAGTRRIDEGVVLQEIAAAVAIAECGERNVVQHAVGYEHERRHVMQMLEERRNEC